jgi:fructose-1,6-bisphosphatase/inositol monophosphatase family enzyme
MSLIDPTFDVPEELKEQVAERLKTTGALRPIIRSVKVAMTAAIAELRGLRREAKSVLEFKKFENATPADLAALQAIYRFLEEHGLKYTLSCLGEESGIEKSENGLDLEELSFAVDTE